MRNLADFKRMIQVAIDEKRQIKTSNYNEKGELTSEKPFTTVCHLQSNAFTLLRDGKESWVFFEKASDWEFNGSLIATQKNPWGGKFAVEISENVTV